MILRIEWGGGCCGFEGRGVVCVESLGVELGGGLMVIYNGI